jgi:hypothetical protein
MFVRRSAVSASSEKNAAAPVAVTPAPSPENHPRPAITHDDPPPQIDPSPVLAAASPAPVVEIPPGPPPDPAKLLAQPGAVAAASVDIVTSAMRVTSFLNRSRQGGHIGLVNDLAGLKIASEAMLADNGSDPAVTTELNSALIRSLDKAITTADDIEGRASETADARQAAAFLRDTLLALKKK